MVWGSFLCGWEEGGGGVMKAGDEGYIMFCDLSWNTRRFDASQRTGWSEHVRCAWPLCCELCK